MMEKIRVYVIDDNQAICDALHFFLGSFNFLDVIIYHDPILFMEQLTPDLGGCLILDLFLPSINGIELIKQIRQQNNQLKIIMASGYNASEIIKNALSAGANDFISKPFSIDNLLSKIQTLIPLKNHSFHTPA